MSTAELTGSGLLGSLLVIGVFAINVNRHGLDGYMERRADRLARQVVWLRTAVEWLRLFRVQGPRVFREIHRDKLGEAGVGREGR